MFGFSTMTECPICMEADLEDAFLQCQDGHYFCAPCYKEHCRIKALQGDRACCPICRVQLPEWRDRVYCLLAQQAIAAAKEVTVIEVQQADAEATVNEVAAACAAADARAAQEAEDAAARLEERIRAEDNARADSAALAIAQAAGDGDIDEQEKAHREWSEEAAKKRAREHAPVEKYTGKLQRTIAAAPAERRIDTCVDVITGVLGMLSPSERARVCAAIAEPPVAGEAAGSFGWARAAAPAGAAPPQQSKTRWPSLAATPVAELVCQWKLEVEALARAKHEAQQPA